MRFVTEREDFSALRRGTAVEKALPDVGPDGTFGWVSATNRGDVSRLRIHVVHDDGRGDRLDVAAFTPLDEHDYIGEGRKLGTFRTEGEFFAAASAAGAADDRWLNAGMVQDFYRERQRLISLVQRVQRGDYADEAELDSLIADISSSVPRPEPTTSPSGHALSSRVGQPRARSSTRRSPTEQPSNRALTSQHRAPAAVG